MKLWDTETGQEVLALKGHIGMVWHTTFAPMARVSLQSEWMGRSGFGAPAKRRSRNEPDGKLCATPGLTKQSATGDGRMRRNTWPSLAQSAVPATDPDTGRVPGAIEGESMKVLANTGGKVAGQKVTEFGRTPDRWSGSEHLWWTGASVGSKLTLELPVEGEGRYEMLAVLTKARDYGIVQLSLDGKNIGGQVDLWNSR